MKNTNDETELDRRGFLISDVHGVGRHRRGVDHDERHSDRLKKMLGLASIAYHDVHHPIAITDMPLESATVSTGADARDVRGRTPTTARSTRS